MHLNVSLQMSSGVFEKDFQIKSYLYCPSNKTPYKLLHKIELDIQNQSKRHDLPSAAFLPSASRTSPISLMEKSLPLTPAFQQSIHIQKSLLLRLNSDNHSHFLIPCKCAFLLYSTELSPLNSINPLLLGNSIFSGCVYSACPLHRICSYFPTQLLYSLCCVIVSFSYLSCLFHLAWLKHRHCLRFLFLSLSSPHPLLSPWVTLFSSRYPTVTCVWEMPKSNLCSPEFSSKVVFHLLAIYFSSGWPTHIGDSICPNYVPASRLFLNLCLTKLEI